MRKSKQRARQLLTGGHSPEGCFAKKGRPGKHLQTWMLAVSPLHQGLPFQAKAAGTREDPAHQAWGLRFCQANAFGQEVVEECCRCIGRSKSIRQPNELN